MVAGEVLRRATVHVTLWTVALSQPLLGLYGDNLAVFTTAQTGGMTVVAFALVVLVVPAITVSALEIGASLVGPRAGLVAHRCLVFVGSWAAVSVIARSISFGAWVVDAAFTAAVAVALTVFYAKRSVVRAWLRWMAGLAPVVLVAFVVAAWPVISPGGPGGVAAARSGDIDVVWLQLDEAPLFPLLTTDGSLNERRFPGFAKLASVSTWYRDAVSVSQRTSVAVPSMLTGRSPDYSLQPVLSDHPRNILTLVRDTMELDVVEEASHLCAGGWCEADAPDPIPRASFASLVKDAAVVAGHTALPRDLRERLPAIDEGWGGFGEGDQEEVPSGDEVPTGEKNAHVIGHRGRLSHIDVLVERQNASTRSAFRFAHVLLPHRPWLLAPDQRISARTGNDYRPGTLEDKRRDMYQSLLGQYLAVDAQISALVDGLRASARWDKTLLVVTADHGITFIPGASTRDEIDPTNVAAIDDIYRVPLFVKLPGQAGGAVDDCAVTVLDIVPTIAGSLGVSPDWELAGADLARGCPDRTTRAVTWLTGTIEQAFGVDALLDRVGYYDRWVDADGSADDIARTGPYGSLIGTTVPVKATTENAVKWTLSNHDAFGRVTGGRFGSVPTRATGVITARRELGDDEEILIAVNDRFVGVAREAAGLGAWRSTLYSSSLLSRFITPGENDVTLWAVRGGASAPVFVQLGPRSP